MPKSIIIKGARQNNLKNVDLEIPRDQMVVVTGLSGSGKSSLAIDTIYAEGQRRYLESINTYARQFLGKMDKPDLDYIEGLSPSIAIEQKAISKNPRSTVGTVTEIYDYLRLLFANIGTPHCPKCGQNIEPVTSQELTDNLIKNLEEGAKFRVLAPIIQRRKGEYSAVFEKLKRDGFVRVIIDGIEYELEEDINLDKNLFHDIDVVIDRLKKKDSKQFKTRLADAVEQAGKLSEGLVKIWVVDKKPKTYSQDLFCPKCQISMPKIRPQLFSFNTPIGNCPNCSGLGTSFEFTERRLFPDQHKSIYESNLREIGGFKGVDSYSWGIIESVAEHIGVDLNDPIEDIPREKWETIIWGTGNEKLTFTFDSSKSRYNDRDFSYTVSRAFEGILNTLQRRYLETSSEKNRQRYEYWMEENKCHVCKGQKLRPSALGITIKEANIADVAQMTVEHALNFIHEIKKSLTERQRIIVKDVLKEIISRYTFLMNVGLDYLTMSRAARTLSGGESERVRLATQIGSNLVGVLYVLDEPTIGLHSRDKFKLINMLKTLRDKGNSIIIVEHDEDIIKNSDFVVDIGPLAGENGGEVVYAGNYQGVLKHPDSLTSKYLRGDMFIPVPGHRRSKITKWIEIKGARENNLKNVDAKLPLGVFTVVTGVSGAGKSSLVMECLYKGTHNLVYNRSKESPGDFDQITGTDDIDKIIHVDQSPIGRTPRSIPATYTKIFTKVRKLFAKTKEAKMRGYDKGRFSFNKSKKKGGGKCGKCGGVGYISIEMQFLPDVMVKCDVCKGQRYDAETLEIEFRNKNIAEVLDLSFNQAREFFKDFPKIKKKIQTVIDVGLGYLRLGQPSPTLSGGEGQRIKLSRELSKRSTGNTLYILDEPTTGLHFHDVKQLLNVIQRLVDQGNTVVLIEHNMDVVKSGDYIIDLGPEGGDEGGHIVANGTPEEIVEVKESYTATYLKDVLNLAKKNDHFEYVKKRKEMPAIFDK